MSTLPIHERHIKAHIGQKATWLSGQEFLGRLAQAGHLAWPKPFGRAGKIPAFLDLDENHGIAVAHDQVDFTTSPAPPAPGYGKPATFIFLRNTLFGGQARMIFRPPLDALCLSCHPSPFPSFKAA